MSPNVTILETRSGEALARWADLRRNVEFDHVFCDLELVGSLAAAQGIDSKTVVVSSDGVDVLAFLATFRRVGPFLEVVPPRLVPFSPILLRADVATVDLLPIVGALRSHLVERYHRIVVTLPPTESRSVLALDDGWKLETLKTYVADLTVDQDHITDNWSAGTRRLYRRSAPLFEIREEPAVMKEIIQLWQNGYERSGRTITVDRNILANAARRVEAPAHCRVFTAIRRDHDLLEGGLVVLVDADHAYYWIAGSLPGPAMTVLVGKVLTQLRSDGIASFDFLGANTPSIAEFKRRFGPSLVSYLQLITSRSRLFEAMLSAKQILSERNASL